MREDFLTIVSHELRNPLKTAALATQVLFHEITETERDRHDDYAVIAARDRAEVLEREAERVSVILDGHPGGVIGIS